MRQAPEIRDSGFEIRNPSARRGFTLVELVVSMGIASALMAGVGASMLIASRAVPSAQGPSSVIVATGTVVSKVMAELQYATSVTARSATMIEFTLADRDSDGVEELIRYEWSGTAGAPLTRQLNAGTAITICTDVRDFVLSYDLDPISALATSGNESGETILRSYGQLLHAESFSITSGSWCGQYFFPVLPADAVSWRVTRVRLYGRTSGTSDGECRVQLQTATSGGLPSGTLLEEKMMLESGFLSGLGAQTFEFSTVSGLSPTAGLCLVVKWIYGETACQLYGYHEGASSSDSILVASTDSGATWTAPSGYGLKYIVYGTVTTSGTPEAVTVYLLDRVNIRLRTGSDANTTVESGVPLFNTPEVSE